MGVKKKTCVPMCPNISTTFSAYDKRMRRHTNTYTHTYAHVRTYTHLRDTCTYAHIRIRILIRTHMAVLTPGRA